MDTKTMVIVGGVVIVLGAAYLYMQSASSAPANDPRLGTVGTAAAQGAADQSSAIGAIAAIAGAVREVAADVGNAQKSAQTQAAQTRVDSGRSVPPTVDKMALYGHA